MEGRRETGNIVRTNQRVQVDWDQVNWSQIKHQVDKALLDTFTTPYLTKNS